MVNSKVLFLSDNQAVVEVLNKQPCTDKMLMRLLRRLVYAPFHTTLSFVQNILQESLT